MLLLLLLTVGVLLVIVLTSFLLRLALLIIPFFLHNQHMCLPSSCVLLAMMLSAVEIEPSVTSPVHAFDAANAMSTESKKQEQAAKDVRKQTRCTRRDKAHEAGWLLRFSLSCCLDAAASPSRYLASATWILSPFCNDLARLCLLGLVHEDEQFMCGWWKRERRKEERGDRKHT